MGWLFRSRRDPYNPRQQRIAVHELGHAYTWMANGLMIRSVIHKIDRGECNLHGYPASPTHPACPSCPADSEQLYAFAIGCWGGFEAENLWHQQHGHTRAARANSRDDIRHFRHATYQYDGRSELSELTARCLARQALAQHWHDITTRVQPLIVNGLLTADDL